MFPGSHAGARFPFAIPGRACWRGPGIHTPGVSSKCQDKDQPTADSLLLLPDGYSDVPAGKIAAVVTHLKMTERPAIPRDPAGTWSLRRVEAPELDWFRDLYRRVGEEWLRFSRLQMSDAELAAIVQSPLVEVYALVHDSRDEGLLELDFRERGQCELAFFGVTAKLIGSGAGRWLMNRALKLMWSRSVTRVWVHT